MLPTFVILQRCSICIIPTVSHIFINIIVIAAKCCDILHIFNAIALLLLLHKLDYKLEKTDYCAKVKTL